MAGARPRIRVAVIGAGMIGRAHAHAFRALRELGDAAPADVELAVVADPDAPISLDAQQRFGFERTAASWEEVAEASDVDLACVALPNFQHREPVEAFLARGRHVLCEKPLATSSRDAWMMLQSARRAGVVHAVGFNLRRTPAVAAIRRILPRGDLGEPRQVSARYLANYAANPDAPFTWRYQRALAGSGALGDVGSHVVDLSRFLLGDIDLVRGAILETFIHRRPVPAAHVTGHSLAATTGEMREVDTDDVGAFVVRFQNGVVGDFHVSRIATGIPNSPAFDLIGSRGSALLDIARPGEFQLFDSTTDGDATGFRRVMVGPEHPHFAEYSVLPVAGTGLGYREMYVVQAHELIRALTSEAPAYVPDFADGYAAVLVSEAVQAAAELGRQVPIAEIAAQAEQP